MYATDVSLNVGHPPLKHFLNPKYFNHSFSLGLVIFMSHIK